CRDFSRRNKPRARHRGTEMTSSLCLCGVPSMGDGPEVKVLPELGR
ncbi:MAG: hypothetical protein AVDCRST_MAG68-46, partial [uncultured Gemmatimonadetes bacterium]